MTTRQLVAPGRDGDVREVVDHISSENRNRKLFGVGFSIGANLLGKMVAIDGDDCKLIAAYCCQAPMIYTETSKNIKNAYFGLIDYHVGKRVFEIH